MKSDIISSHDTLCSRGEKFLTQNKISTLEEFYHLHLIHARLIVLTGNNNSSTDMLLDRKNEQCCFLREFGGGWRNVKAPGLQKNSLHLSFSKTSLNWSKVKAKGAILLTGVYVGCSSPFLQPLSLQVDTSQSLWCMASVMPDLRLPSQPLRTVTVWLCSFPMLLMVECGVGLNGWLRTKMVKRGHPCQY